MPNTLIHIAIQAPASRLFQPKMVIPWIAAGIIIPDIPWIFQRISKLLDLFDPFQQQIYFSVQASFAFCLILSIALSQFHQERFKLFILLAVNSLAHLLLDATQIKWGNGVHLFAPFSWKAVNFGLIWPEHPAGYAIACGGALYLLFILPTVRKEGVRLPFTHGKIIFLALFVYFLLPFAFLDSLQESNVNYIDTLKNKGERTGKPIVLDRATYLHDTGQIRIFTGEILHLAGKLPEGSDRLSVKGLFISPDTIRIKESHNHSSYRDFASYIGLSLVAALWLAGLFSNQVSFRRKRNKL